MVDPIRQHGGPITADAQACLKGAGALAPCDRCVEVCPSGSLSWSGRQPTVDGNCSGCGRCAAVCPNDALEVEGFAPASLPMGEEVVLACSRDRDAAALAVPCLGGLTAMLLLELADASNRPLLLVDRSWCSACAVAAGNAAPWSAAVADAKDLLGLAGWPHTLRVETRPLPIANAAGVPKANVDLGRRRALFPIPLAASTTGLLPRGRVSARRRRVEQTWLARLAARSRRGPVTEALPAVTVGEACRDHGICAALCPTGALEHWDGSGERGLAFDPMKCLACGRCAQACPSEAVTFLPRGGRIAGRAVIARHASAICGRCSTRFAAESGETLCPTCAKRHALGQAAFSLQFNQVRG